LAADGVAAFGFHGGSFGVVGQLTAQAVEHHDHVFERFLFLAQVLGALGVVPDGGVFEGGVDLAELQGLGIVVKDTSVTRPRGC
jgi:hypothetical protein